ncbi:hypothetical protein ANCCEY_13701 [Ancylostoma ceylanicum]|uniref:Uncharacterized protein n=1 Tax=Ancylostoma ceylanicum TaxID=53326 RepID=A0A0D6L863_9BILA|nr:hypothetical protein ANCCEY_13701 [Ancylostoma ceylanicum]
MKLLNVILMLIFAIVGISAMGPVRARRSYSEAQGERNGLYNIEYDGVPDALPPRRVRFYRTGGTILLG